MRPVSELITINDYPIDAALAESHSFESEVTEFPVEEGATISDHIRKKPRRWTVEGVVSNTPLGPLAGVRTASQFADGLLGQTVRSPVAEARAVLTAIWENRQPVTINTSHGVYKNMVLLSIEFATTADDTLQFSGSFSQIIIENNVRATVKIARKFRKQNRGNVASKPPNWIGTDANGNSVVFKSINGVDKYYKADGTEVSPDEAAAATRRHDAVLTKYDKAGNAIPVSDRDYQPYTPKQRTSWWAPFPRGKI